MLKKNIETNNILAYNQLNTLINVTSFIKIVLNL